MGSNLQIQLRSQKPSMHNENGRLTTCSAEYEEYTVPTLPVNGT